MAETIPPVSVTEQKDVRVVEFTNNRILDEANIAEIGTGPERPDRRAKTTPSCCWISPTVDHLGVRRAGDAHQRQQARSRQKNGQLRLANIKPQIFEVFVITKLNKLFRILPTRTKRWRASTSRTTRAAASGLRTRSARRECFRTGHRSWRRRAQGRVGDGGGGGRRTAKVTLVCTIPSDFDAGRDVQAGDPRRTSSATASASDAPFAIRIALEEAMVNAIKHGNRLDPNKTVHVEAQRHPRAGRDHHRRRRPGLRPLRRPRPARRRKPLKSPAAAASC